jgi:hypothetical protein
MQNTLTRYLYPKELVKASLVWAILDKQVEETLFWGYELYYSGFRAETFDLIISIYVMYFKEKHPLIKPYLCRQLDKWYSQEKNTSKKFLSQDTIIGSILRNFATLTVSLTTISRFRLGIKPVVTQENESDDDSDDLTEDPILLPDLSPSDIKSYKTNYELPSCKTIRKVTSYPIRTQYCNILCTDNDDDTYDVFELSTRIFEKPLYANEFSYNNWLYHASGSPIWKNRIISHEGKICHGTQQIVFMDDDQEEQFYNKYDYEIDEQPSELRDKIFGKEWSVGQRPTKGVSTLEHLRCSEGRMPTTTNFEGDSVAGEVWEDTNTYISWEYFYEKYGSESVFNQINIRPYFIS